MIEDKSNDKKYFTIIPNIVIDQDADEIALYVKMKRLAGQNGLVTAGDSELKKTLRWGHKRFTGAIRRLTAKNYILAGKKQRVSTAGGEQWKKTYKILDIWSANLNHYYKKKEEK